MEVHEEGREKKREEEGFGELKTGEMGQTHARGACNLPPAEHLIDERNTVEM